MDDYSTFIKECYKDLLRIARASKGQHDLSDVQSEIWIQAAEISQKLNFEVDYTNPEHQELLIKYTYCKLIKYSETFTQFAESLNQPKFTDSNERLIDSIISINDRSPLEILNEQESNDIRNQKTSEYTLGNAWLRLLDLHHNRMVLVSQKLKISLSYCYKCYNRALDLTQMQEPIPFTKKVDSSFSPQPWRPFKISRLPQQLELDLSAPDLLSA